MLPYPSPVILLEAWQDVTRTICKTIILYVLYTIYILAWFSIYLISLIFFIYTPYTMYIFMILHDFANTSSWKILVNHVVTVSESRRQIGVGALSPVCSMRLNRKCHLLIDPLLKGHLSNGSDARKRRSKCCLYQESSLKMCANVTKALECLFLWTINGGFQSHGVAPNHPF